MKQLTIKKVATNKINIHNDISNTANHLRKRVEEMAETGKRDGISLDITACLVLLAFTFESRLNFIGDKAVKDWKERRPFDKKVMSIIETLGLGPNFDSRPYSTIDQLKNFRDTIAHGQPTTVKIDETLVVNPEDSYDQVDLRGEWENFLTLDFMRQCSDDIDLIWEEWLKAARIDRFETLTHGFHSFELVEAKQGA